MKMAIRTQYKPPQPKSAVKKSPKVKSSGYGVQSNSAKGCIKCHMCLFLIFFVNLKYHFLFHKITFLISDTYDIDRYSDQLNEMRLAPSAGRRAKENVLSNMNRYPDFSK